MGASSVANSGEVDLSLVDSTSNGNNAANNGASASTTSRSMAECKPTAAPSCDHRNTVPVWQI